MQESTPQNELDKAYESRAKGNEGMARVLARRAAGMALRKFLRDQETPALSLNAMLCDERIRILLPEEIHPALERLSTRVNSQYQTPFQEDLLLDTKLILETLKIDGEKNG